MQTPNGLTIFWFIFKNFFKEIKLLICVPNTAFRFKAQFVIIIYTKNVKLQPTHNNPTGHVFQLKIKIIWFDTYMSNVRRFLMSSL
jgi:hypothetical protein